MTTPQLTDRVCRLISAELYIDDSKVLRTSRFYADLSADSIAMSTLFVALERSFGLALAWDELEDCETVGELCDYLERRLKP